MTAQDIHADRILVLDFGSPFTQLIARRIRGIGVFCEIHPFDVSEDVIRAFNPRGIILSGAPEVAQFSDMPVVPQWVFDLQLPVLGLGYGMHAIAQHFGGQVQGAAQRQFTAVRVDVIAANALLDGVRDAATVASPSGLDVLISHGEQVTVLPVGFNAIASTESCAIAGIADAARNYYGLQFHPEETQTTQGLAIISRFVLDICACAGLWTPAHIVDDAIAKVRAQVGDRKVLLGLSGGVDSSVVAALLHKAIGDQLTCVFVDHGLLRLHEGDQVMRMFAENMGVKVIRVDAEQRYLDLLKGVTDPETKRKIIGRTFIEIFDEESSKLEGIDFLAQGTIYPDVIESASIKGGKTVAVKSHHNVGGLPEDMKFELVEPLRELFKDEVRKLGVELGLPHDMVYRHPFPGPGLGVRILGEVTKEYADVLRQADHIFIEELRKAGWYDKTSQAFAVFLPVKSVGVVNDERRYAWVVSLRAVETIDFMTARWAHLPYELLETVSGRIITEIEGVSRVVYDVSSKPPATIEWE